jgi:hypothetical protein
MALVSLSCAWKGVLMPSNIGQVQGTPKPFRKLIVKFVLLVAEQCWLNWSRIIPPESSIRIFSFINYISIH